MGQKLSQIILSRRQEPKLYLEQLENNLSRPMKPIRTEYEPVTMTPFEARPFC
jgi:hypothetical protein